MGPEVGVLQAIVSSEWRTSGATVEGSLLQAHLSGEGNLRSCWLAVLWSASEEESFGTVA